MSAWAWTEAIRLKKENESFKAILPTREELDDLRSAVHNAQEEFDPEGWHLADAALDRIDAFLIERL